MDRRITTKVDNEREDKLKHIAGLLQKLTYTEMNQLAVLIGEDVDTSLYERVPAGLLKVAERILNHKPGASL